MVSCGVTPGRHLRTDGNLVSGVDLQRGTMHRFIGHKECEVFVDILNDICNVDRLAGYADNNDV